MQNGCGTQRAKVAKFMGILERKMGCSLRSGFGSMLGYGGFDGAIGCFLCPFEFLPFCKYSTGYFKFQNRTEPKEHGVHGGVLSKWEQFGTVPGKGKLGSN